MSLSPHRLTVSLRAALAALVLAPAAAAIAADRSERPRLDRVEITGTRIKKPSIEGPAPIQVITRADLVRSGLTSIADVIQQLTGAGSALNSRFNSSGNFGFPPDGSGIGAGSATADLRHLGAKRVLVLVDGVRWVNEASASGVSSATDLNTLPLSIVERIEVLEDGASSIYGSDAIGGVINILTRRQFTGATASAQFGEYQRGGAQRAADLALGGAGERFSYFFSASAVDQDALGSSAYVNARLPKPGTGLVFGSAATPNGRFWFVDPTTGREHDITTPNGQFYPAGPNYPSDFIPFGTEQRFNFAPFNLLQTPSERQALFAQTRFEVSERSRWYLRALYNQRESAHQAAPEPILLGPDAGTGNRYADAILISASNPYNPFGFDLISSGRDANLRFIGRRPIEGGPRRFLQDVDTWYLATGLEGEFDLGHHGWFWDINLVRSRNRAEQTNFGSYNIRRIAQALGPLDACQADPQCVPLDIFSGPGSITPAMLAYIQPVVRDASENNLLLYSANLSGDLLDLPAGALALAVGVEHRRQDGHYQPDGLTVAGEYNGVPSLPTAGAFEVDEVYAEFNLPVYETGSSRLDLTVSGRHSDHSNSGGEATGKFGLRWQLSDDLLLRGTFAEGFRAPSIGELFGSAARFDAVLSDPCLRGLDGSDATAPAAVCDALGVPRDDRGSPPQQANAQIAVTTGGNPELQPESADSYTLGVVWSPAFANGSAWSQRLDLQVSYYRHDLAGAIQAIDAQTQLDLCTGVLPAIDAGGPASPFCAGISRGPTGIINGFNNRLQNFGRIETDGYDVDLLWTLPELASGRWQLSWLTTWVRGYRAEDRLGTRQPQGVGIEVNNSGIPEWTSVLDLDWQRGSWSAGLALRYLDGMNESCGMASGFPVCSDPLGKELHGGPDTGITRFAVGRNRLPSITYTDLRLGWRAPWFGGTQLTLGLNNAFNRDPPICLSCSLNGYDPSTYDLPAGRFLYARAELKF